MRLASDEATAISEQLEHESAVRLQAILDHVKDGIVSCDHLGRIDSMNRTAERFFGVHQSGCCCRSWTGCCRNSPIAATLAVYWRSPRPPDNTHYDLAAHEITARHQRGDAMPAEIRSARC